MEEKKVNSFQQLDPWTDFFRVYIDLGHALLDEFKRDESVELQEINKLKDLLVKIEEGESGSRWHRDLVHDVIKRFRNKSKDILFQDPKYFDAPLCLFPGIDGIDIAKMWQERPMYRDGLWQWIEQLYVIGNVCLHPNRKDKFLDIVKQLKRMRQGLPEQPVEQQPEENDDISGVVQGMAQMFGMDDNPAMSELMTDLAKHMHTTMSETANPMDLLQSMISGDMSCLGDLQGRMEQKISDKISTGELTEEDFERQQQGMMQNFGGMEGLMKMAGGLGLNTEGLSTPQEVIDQTIVQQQQPLQQLQQQRTGHPKKKSKKKKKKRK